MIKEEHDIFLSWSGAHSHEIATFFRDWLPNVVPDSRPWISDLDIAKGTIWSKELNASLAKCSIGIVVLTPENLTSPWVLFESGVLFTAREEGVLLTLCCGVDLPLVGPLGQFQATVFNKQDVLLLVLAISASTGNYSDERVTGWFEKFWPDLKKGVNNISKKYTSSDLTVRASDRELLVELLDNVRPLRKFQERIEDSGLSESLSITWYRPYWISKGMECTWLSISQNTVGKFMNLQMQNPRQADRLLRYLWQESEALTNPKEEARESKLSNMTFIWYAHYNSALRSRSVYLNSLSIEVEYVVLHDECEFNEHDISVVEKMYDLAIASKQISTRPKGWVRQMILEGNAIALRNVDNNIIAATFLIPLGDGSSNSATSQATLWRSKEFAPIMWREMIEIAEQKYNSIYFRIFKDNKSTIKMVLDQDNIKIISQEKVPLDFIKMIPCIDEEYILFKWTID